METWRGAYAHVFPPELLAALDVDERERMWRQAIANRAMAVFVAEEDRRVVGFVSVGPSRERGADGEGEVYAIYVRPDSWGSGAGSALMEAGRAWLAERYPAATLWVLADNPRARRFYEREGWTADATRTEEVRGIDVHEVRYRVSFLEQR